MLDFYHDQDEKINKIFCSISRSQGMGRFLKKKTASENYFWSSYRAFVSPEIKCYEFAYITAFLLFLYYARFLIMIIGKKGTKKVVCPFCLNEILNFSKIFEK